MIDIGLPTYKELDYEAFNSGGVEREVGEFLYGMVRIVKPEAILETGTHKGISSAYMGLGLRDNNKGHLHTIEFDTQHYQDAENLWGTIGLTNISLFKGGVRDFQISPGDEYDIIFLDTEPDQRFAELIRFFPYLREGGFVFIHDLHHHLSQQSQPGQPDNWPFGTLPDQIKEWLRSGELKPWHFPNPRGLVGFQKRKDGDYDVNA